jgi:uncharacterized delta-60 repeat protein
MHIPRHPAAIAASLLAVGAVGTGVAIAATAPGDQDPDFNGGTAQLVDFPGVPDGFGADQDYVTRVAVAPDGSIYVAGCTWYCNSEGDADTSIGHLTADGAVDQGFGADGEGAISDGDHRLAIGPTALGFTPGGDLLVGGSSHISEYQMPPRSKTTDGTIAGLFTVYHYNKTGGFEGQARDDFDGQGSVYNSSPRGFLPTRDGGQLVLGSVGDGNIANNHFATATLSAAGSFTADSIDELTQAKALIGGHQPTGADGSYVIAGAGQTFTPPVTDDLRTSRIQAEDPAPAWVLHRYNADGTRDDSYGGEFPIGDGVQDVDTDDSDGSIAGDGATYLLADTDIGTDAYSQQLVRFTADGKPDAAFGTQTAATIFGDTDDSYYLDAVAGTADGKAIVVADHYTGLGGQTLVARLNADGTLDQTFGDGGIRELPLVSNADEMDGVDVALQSDGKAVVAGDAVRFGKEIGLKAKAAALSALGSGEHQAFVTRVAGDSRPVTTTTTTDTTPAATTTATTTTTQTTTTTAARPVAAQSVPKACASKRAFTIRLRIPRHVTAVSATVKVNGRQVKVLKGSRLRSTVNLRGLPKGTFKVSITVKVAHGKRSLRGTRTYHTCIPKRGDSIPVL